MKPEHYFELQIPEDTCGMCEHYDVDTCLKHGFEPSMHGCCESFDNLTDDIDNLAWA